VGRLRTRANLFVSCDLRKVELYLNTACLLISCPSRSDRPDWVPYSDEVLVTKTDLDDKSTSINELKVGLLSHFYVFGTSW
jgi:hypothetical protein